MGSKDIVRSMAQDKSDWDVERFAKTRMVRLIRRHSRCVARSKYGDCARGMCAHGEVCSR